MTRRTPSHPRPPAKPALAPTRSQAESEPSGDDSRMRVAKALSLLGHCSRREAERLIAAGRVSIDGTVVPGPATLVDPTSQALSVDGRDTHTLAVRGLSIRSLLELLGPGEMTLMQPAADAAIQVRNDGQTAPVVWARTGNEMNDD